MHQPIKQQMSPTNIEEKNHGGKMPLILSGKERKKFRKMTLGFGNVKAAAIACSLSRDTIHKALRGKKVLSKKSYQAIKKILE